MEERTEPNVDYRKLPCWFPNGKGKDLSGSRMVFEKRRSGTFIWFNQMLFRHVMLLAGPPWARISRCNWFKSRYRWCEEQNDNWFLMNDEVLLESQAARLIGCAYHRLKEGRERGTLAYCTNMKALHIDEVLRFMTARATFPHLPNQNTVMKQLLQGKKPVKWANDPLLEPLIREGNYLPWHWNGHFQCIEIKKKVLTEPLVGKWDERFPIITGPKSKLPLPARRKFPKED